jgi:hypothetical protein
MGPFEHMLAGQRPAGGERQCLGNANGRLAGRALRQQPRDEAAAEGDTEQPSARRDRTVVFAGIDWSRSPRWHQIGDARQSCGAIGDDRRRRALEVDLMGVGERVLENRDGLAPLKQLDDVAPIFFGVEKGWRCLREFEEIFGAANAGKGFVAVEQWPERNRIGSLAALDHLADRGVDAPENRSAEMLRAQEGRHLSICRVFNQHGSEQCMFGLGAMGRLTLRRDRVAGT